MASWVRYGNNVDASERMSLNDQYWEEQYQRAKKFDTDKETLLLKICPSCGRSGRTGLSYCYRKAMHSGMVKLNVVPKDLEPEVLK